MAELPQLTDYVHLIIELFGRLRQERSASAAAKLGLTRHPLTTALTPAVLLAARPQIRAHPPNPRPNPGLVISSVFLYCIVWYE